MEVLRTNISQAFWCATTSTGVDFEPAKFPREAGPGFTTRAWFDELLEGGLQIPDKGERPLTVLIAGPPGSGKTTFTMELCYRLARGVPGDGGDKPQQDSLFSLYISTDQPADQLIRNTASFGYSDAERTLVDFQVDPKKPDKYDLGRVAVWGRDRIQMFIKEQQNESLAEDLEAIVNGALTGLSLLLQNQIAANIKSKKFIERLLNRKINTKQLDKDAGRVQPDILVVDSLNIVVPDLRKEFFTRFQSAISTGCRMVIFVMDTASEGGYHEIWEYASDVVIRLDNSSANDYYLRTIQIVKARYQSHIWGKHQLKIYKKPALANPGNPQAYEDIMRRSYPYRNVGGIFIYPSIHYYLSTYKRRGPVEQVSFAETWPRLTGVLDEGIPEGRCTAFIGTRGGHKSHFGYLHLLHRILNWQVVNEGRNVREEAALIISLRDDERMTWRTLEQIRSTEFPAARTSLDDLRRADKLEILYFHPGYITPEEFFNRVFVSLKRLKKDDHKVTVLFNSVDQLSSRFPLCARQEILIPGIIETLTGESATSIFIAVNEPDQPSEQYGLLPMADLILSFTSQSLTYEAYFRHRDTEAKLMHESGAFRNRIDEWRSQYLTVQSGAAPELEVIVLQVKRFAGGQKAGARGILELVEAKDLGLYPRPGLHFTKLNPLS